MSKSVLFLVILLDNYVIDERLNCFFRGRNLVGQRLCRAINIANGGQHLIFCCRGDLPL